MSYPKTKCMYCRTKDAVAVEKDTFFYCALCWLKKYREKIK
tara:strand:+ start:941 stop:1063 length:123 start_codon:yes stop_codon:yes gene_type:complete